MDTTDTFVTAYQHNCFQLRAIYIQHNIHVYSAKFCK